MKKFIPIIFGVSILMACQQNSAQLLSPEVFKEKVTNAANVVVLDVRRPDELASSGYIEGAMNIVYNDEFDQAITDLPKNPIYVYCAGGVRSHKAAKILQDQGHEVFELEGGLNAWLDAGLPVVVD